MREDEQENDDRMVFHETGASPAEQTSRRDAAAPGGGTQGIDGAGARGTADGGLSAEEDVGIQGSGLTGARAVEGEEAEADQGALQKDRPGR